MFEQTADRKEKRRTPKIMAAAVVGLCLVMVPIADATPTIPQPGVGRTTLHVGWTSG